MNYEEPAAHENIHLERADDVRRWTRELDVTVEELRTAVQNVGTNEYLVRNYLANQRKRRRTHVR
jgi:hypothetical protein